MPANPSLPLLNSYFVPEVGKPVWNSLLFPGSSILHTSDVTEVKHIEGNTYEVTTKSGSHYTVIVHPEVNND